MGSFSPKLNVTSTRAGIRLTEADIGASGWMVGADPKFQQRDRAGQVIAPGAAQYRQIPAPRHSAGSHRWRWIALLSVVVPLSFVLVQCGKAPSAGMLAANAHASAADSFDGYTSVVPVYEGAETFGLHQTAVCPTRGDVRCSTQSRPMPVAGPRRLLTQAV